MTACAATPPEVLAHVRTPDFLRKCLRNARLDEDLIADVADACELGELTALDLGSGQLTSAEAADRLFLTQDEAKLVLSVCRRQCLRAGVDYGDGEVYVPNSDDEWLHAPDPNATKPAPAAKPSGELGCGAPWVLDPDSCLPAGSPQRGPMRPLCNALIAA